MDRWKEIQDTFEKALELEGSARVEFISSLLASDAELGNEVQSLLSSLHDAGDFFDEPAAKLDAVIDSHEPDLESGKVIGSYKIIRKLGEGGMGSVYLADRADKAFERETAIKIVSKGRYDTAAKSRFLEEQNILAKLEHPNIAQLYDAGVTDKGEPYLVMEYVEGLPVDEYCDENNLDVKGRLVLFRKILEAVHYAHQNLIIHQDIKPNNILVESEGEPKLLDFGIAKTLDSSSLGSIRNTVDDGTHQNYLTPAYASPEQVKGGSVTTASDVYSLGILLYQLLSGHKAYQFKATKNRDEISNIICEQEPTLPSKIITNSRTISTARGREKTLTAEDNSALRSTDVNSLKRKLSGDLDHVIMMAVDKSPKERYQTALEFAHDIDRFLLGLPTQAHPSSFFYDAQKFIRRNSTGVVASGTTLVVIMAIVGQLLKGRFENSSLNRTSTPSARVSLVQDSDLAGSDESLRLRFMEQLFQSQNGNSSFSDSTSLGDFLANNRASLLARNIAATDKIALLDQIGGLYASIGNMEEAERCSELAVILVQNELPDDALSSAQANYNLARVKLTRDDAFGADVVLDNSINSLRADHADTALFARLLHAKANAKRDLNQNKDAEALLREALKVRRDVLPNDHEDLVENFGDLGSLLAEQSQVQDATQFYRWAISMSRRLYGSEPHEHMVELLDGYGSVHGKQGNFDAAEAAFFESTHIRRDLFGAKHLKVAQGLLLMAEIYLQKGDLGTAIEKYEEAAEIVETFHDQEHPDLAELLHSISTVKEAIETDTEISAYQKSPLENSTSS